MTGQSALSLLIGIFAFAGSASAAETLSATITYGREMSDTADDASEEAMQALLAADGSIIHLHLKLVPGRYPIEEDPPDQPAFGFKVTSLAGSDAPFACGTSGDMGIIDNYRNDYIVTFGSPSDHHWQATLYTGTKRTYPAQDIVCSIEGYTENHLTPLLVSGYFHVTVGAIPTLNQVLLVPADPPPPRP